VNFARPLLAAGARHTPSFLIRAVGRRTGGHTVFARLDALARATLAGDQVIARGAGTGLRFNTGGGRPGYALGTWEPDVQRVFASILESGRVVYDIGAASGFYAVIAARAVGSTGQVIAFEPMPESVARLRYNIALNDFTNVSVFELALGDSVGVAKLVPGIEEDQAGVDGLLPVDESGAAIEVEVTTIDHLVDEGAVPPPDMIKVDIEGAEIEMLAGAERTLSQRHPVLLIESHGRWSELEPLLKAHRYRYHVVEENGDLASPEPIHVFATP
jgi:FkbM family methyltransferase